jgi:hypothetical protein
LYVCDDEVKNEWSCTSTPTIVFMIYYYIIDGEDAPFPIFEYISRCSQDMGWDMNPAPAVQSGSFPATCSVAP